MRIEKKQMEIGRDFFLYGLSFLLLMEWLLPLPHITDTGYIHVFVLCMAVFFFITFLQLPVLLSMFLKFLTIVYGVYLVFYNMSFFSIDWVLIFLDELLLNINFMLSGEWHALTDVFRSMLFLVLLSIMSYLLFYWTVYARRVLFFFVFTVIFVAVIDTFTAYDATFAIIRTFFIGFLLLGLITMYRLIEQEKLHSGPKFLPVKLASVLVVMIVFGATFGLLSPKPDPQWADPVPYVRAAIGLPSNGEGVRKIGYGNNDESLGGGFVDDSSTIFYAAAKQEHYWRGETKDFYTGRGWETTTPDEVTDMVTIKENAGYVTTEEMIAEVAFSEETSTRHDHLFYPGAFLELLNKDEVDVRINRYTEKASTISGGELVDLADYRMTYSYPTYYIEGLRATNEQDPEEIKSYYTQVPESLPDRVRELAKEIVQNEDNRYDKAKAVEQYFSLNNFDYETENVPIPVGQEDYVDQFLFETRRGYCDNFSTSMIVLLRTLDIPARWAKGFTQGEVVEQLDDDRNVYEVKNSNAHSWVEVYFPEVGWVPFEPTQGFSSAYDFVEPELDTELPEQPEVEPEQPIQEEEPEVEEAFADAEETEDESSLSNGSSNWTLPGGPWLLAGLLFAFIMFILFKNKKIVQYFVLRRYKHRRDETAFLPAYERLLWLFQYFGYKRNDGETLREFATRMDRTLETEEMTALTTEYERITYGGRPLDSSWKEQKSNWLTLVQKIDS